MTNIFKKIVFFQLVSNKVLTYAKYQPVIFFLGLYSKRRDHTTVLESLKPTLLLAHFFAIRGKQNCTGHKADLKKS